MSSILSFRTAVVVSTILGIVMGSVAATELNQLETARLVQRDQRAEFAPLNGEDSPFKFNFVQASRLSRLNATVVYLEALNPLLDGLLAPLRSFGRRSLQINIIACLEIRK